MRSLKYAEILARNRELGESCTGKPYRIALLSNIVVNQLGEILEFALRSRSINAEVVCGDYDNIVQDSSRFKDADAALIFWEAANLVDGLHAQANNMAEAELDAIVSRVRGEIALVLGNLRYTPLVLLNRFTALPFCADELRPTALESLCTALNGEVDAHRMPNLLSVDTERVFSKTGLNAATDFRQYQSSKALYAVEFLKGYVEHIEPAFLSVAGRGRKALILDCDNTLWGGVLGEDGKNGIQIGNGTRAGKAFREVQYIIKGLKQEGVMLALCSKNNPEDVEEVFETHPDMILRNDDFVARRVNWQDKAANLRALSQEMNIGLDSMVFLDDSEFELGLVRESLPEVLLMPVPGSLSEYPSAMRHARRHFFTLSRTAEDACKTRMYQQEGARKIAAEQYSSVEDYLRSLDLKIKVLADARLPVERAAQLTQKTNQFNLTTRRYAEADISRFLADGRHLLAAINVADRFGDYGVTGLAIVELGDAGTAARLDSFLMSCRIIGRNIEFAFFDYLVEALRQKGVRHLLASYLATPKNGQVSGFFDSLGFETTERTEQQASYRISLGDYKSRHIDYIEASSDEG
jgi:FkbH-like protein